MSKAFEEWTFEELVNDNAGMIMEKLIAGRFKEGVWLATERGLRWNQEQVKKPSTKGKAK